MRKDIESKECPICKKSENEYGKIRDIKHHISNMARGELFRNALADKTDPTPHMNYIKKHAMVVSKMDFTL